MKHPAKNSTALKKSRRLSSALLGSEHKITIEKLAVGGWGIARIPETSEVQNTISSHDHEGLAKSSIACFIPNTAPGDILKIKVVAVHKNFLEGEIVKILNPGPDRITPPCPHAMICGGCNWQHLNQKTQLKQKEILLAEILKKFLPEHKIDLHPIQKSPKNFNYRSRIQPKIKNNKIGYFSKKSHELVSVQNCLLAEDPLNSLFPKALETFSSRSLQRLEFYLDSQNQPQIKKLPDLQSSVHISSVSDRKSSSEKSGNKAAVLLDEDDGFSQVNAGQNLDLISWVLQLSKSQTYTHIYDLYAGAGNFTFPLSDEFKKLKMMAVEKYTPLAQKGRELTGKKPIQFINTSVEIFLKRHLLKKDALVLLDPPRGGAEPYVMTTLAQSQPEKIIYISCNPVTMARDLRTYFDELLRLHPSSQLPYSIQSIKPFEMFPQTSHMEVIVEIVRN